MLISCGYRSDAKNSWAHSVIHNVPDSHHRLSCSINALRDLKWQSGIRMANASINCLQSRLIMEQAYRFVWLIILAMHRPGILCNYQIECKIWRQMRWNNISKGGHAESSTQTILVQGRWWCPNTEQRVWDEQQVSARIENTSRIWVGPQVSSVLQSMSCMLIRSARLQKPGMYQNKEMYRI